MAKKTVTVELGEEEVGHVVNAIDGRLKLTEKEGAGLRSIITMCCGSRDIQYVRVARDTIGRPQQRNSSNIYSDSTLE